MCCGRSPDSEIAVERMERSGNYCRCVGGQALGHTLTRITVGDTCQHGHGPCHADTDAADHEQRGGGAGEEQAAGGCRALWKIVSSLVTRLSINEPEFIR